MDLITYSDSVLLNTKFSGSLFSAIAAHLILFFKFQAKKYLLLQYSANKTIFDHLYTFACI